jgi:hypothetical protein
MSVTGFEADRRTADWWLVTTVRAAGRPRGQVSEPMADPLTDGV